MIRVAIADDHRLVRTGLGALLDAEPDISVLGMLADGRETVEFVRATDVDVVLMDLEMPELDGVDATREVRELKPEVTVLILTTFVDDDRIAAALKAGAAGYLLKTGSTEELIAAVRDAASGRRAFAPDVLERLAQRFADPQARSPYGSASESGRGGPQGKPPELHLLTEREYEVFVEVGRGRSNHDVAQTLHLSEATVKTYVTRILAKLGIKSRVQIVVLAFETGIVTRDAG